MSSNIEIEPGATSESVLVATESSDNFEEMSSSLDEIKNTSDISPIEELNENDNLQSEEIVDTQLLNLKDEEDQIIHRDWRSKQKHIFVLSSAGKPIYSRQEIIIIHTIYQISSGLIIFTL